MSKLKTANLIELVNEYNDDFINSISLKDITNAKELKALLAKLEKANETVTSFFLTLYNDYIMMINSDMVLTNGPTYDEVVHYKTLASKIQKAYNYILFINTFENPFKSNKNK